MKEMNIPWWQKIAEAVALSNFAETGVIVPDLIKSFTERILDSLKKKD